MRFDGFTDLFFDLVFDLLSDQHFSIWNLGNWLSLGLNLRLLRLSIGIRCRLFCSIGRHLRIIRRSTSSSRYGLTDDVIRKPVARAVVGRIGPVVVAV